MDAALFQEFKLWPHASSLPGRFLPEEGFVRISAIISPSGPIPVSKSTWWAGVKTGRFPAPVKLGPGITVWKVEDIRNLIDKAS